MPNCIRCPTKCNSCGSRARYVYIIMYRRGTLRGRRALPPKDISTDKTFLFSQHACSYHAPYSRGKVHLLFLSHFHDHSSYPHNGQVAKIIKK